MVGDKESALRKGRSNSVGDSPAQNGVFAIKGEYWTVGLGASSFPIRDLKGLGYIRRLLQHPGQEFHAFDLLGSAGGDPNTPETIVGREEALPVGVTVRAGLTGDAGEILDAQAKREYKRRLQELSEELEEQRERGNHERADQLETEIDFVARELERSIGLGGRDRHTGSNAERARLNVTRAIKGAVQKISEQHAGLGELLDHTIRTGSFCSYLPDKDRPVVWQFATNGSAVVREVSVPVPEPIVPSRDTSFLRGYIEGTAFIGRDAERATLLRALDQAERGHGKIVVISGTAGVGKTRIAAEIAAEASRRTMLTFVGACYDRDEPVPFIPFVEILEAALAQRDWAATFRDALGSDAAEIARLVPQLRRAFPDIPAPAELPPEQSRRVLFGAVTEMITRIARNTPSLFLLDDLQWADDGSLLLLNHLAPYIRELPVMIVATVRDFEVQPGDQLNRALDELIRNHLVERITLAGLSEPSVAEMLHALSGREPPAEVVRFFYAGTEGNPFFVEELFKHLHEQGQLLDSSGEFRRDLKLGDVGVPQSLRLVVGRRLARLGDDTLKALGTAAVIGRSFTFDLLGASMRADADSLLDFLEEAEGAGLISSTLEYPHARFQFSHELVRQAVLTRLSVARRQRLHLDIADAIERVFADSPEERVGDLVHHLFQAGTAADGAKTARYAAMAARRALQQGALTEAEELYRRALDVLGTTAQTPARSLQELELQLGLGQTYITTRGYTFRETSATYDRAAALGEQLGEPLQVVLAYAGQFAQPLLRGEIKVAQTFADRIRDLAERSQQKQTALSFACHFQGCSRYHGGELEMAREYLGQAIAMYREEDHREMPQETGLEAQSYIALTQWQLGMIDTARARSREAIALAERLRKPFALAHTRYFASHLNVMLRNPVACQKIAELGIEQAQDQSLALFLHIFRMLRGWALAQQGHCEEGIASARAGLASFKAEGYGLSIGAFLGFLAEAIAQSGEMAEALATVEEGISAMGDQLIDLPHLLWLRGEFQTRQSAVELAEASFRESIAVAKRLGARTLALRSSTSLGRLLAAQGRKDEARGVVAPLLKEFTEGFDTRDLIEAKEIGG